MNKKGLNEAISRTLNNINEQAATIQNYPGKVPQIFYDLLKEHTRRFYEYIHELENFKESPQSSVISSQPRTTSQPKAETPPSPPPKPVKETPLPPKPVVEKPTPVQEKPVAEKPKTAQSRAKEEIKVVPKKSPQSSVISDQPKAEIPKPVEEKPKPITEKPKPVANKPKSATSSSKKSIADKMLQHEDTSLGAKLKSSKVKDLKKAIGIGDKFVFIKELFDGNADEYANAIEQLNTSNDFNEAMNLLNVLRIKYDWADDSEAHLKLVEMTESRYN